MRGKIETILRSRAVGAVALGAFATLSQGAALAAEPQRLVSNPPVLQERAPGPMVEATPPRDQNKGPVLMSAAPRRGLPLSPTRDHVFDLFVTYTDGQLYNPGTGLYDKVRLRSYQGAQVDPKGALRLADDAGPAGRHGAGGAAQQTADRQRLRARAYARQRRPLFQRHQPA